MSYYLVKQSGPAAAPAVIYLHGNQEMTIGRSPDATVSIAAVRISRVHAILTPIDNQWHILDKRSLNGVYINGRKIQPMTNYRLYYDDLIQFGLSNEVSVSPYECVCSYKVTTAARGTAGSPDVGDAKESIMGAPRLPPCTRSADQAKGTAVPVRSTYPTSSAGTTAIAGSLTACHATSTEPGCPPVMPATLLVSNAGPLRQNVAEQGESAELSRGRNIGSTSCSEPSQCCQDQVSSHRPGDQTPAQEILSSVAADANTGGQQPSKLPCVATDGNMYNNNYSNFHLPEVQQIPSVPSSSQSRLALNRKRAFSELFLPDCDVPSETAVPALRRKMGRYDDIFDVVPDGWDSDKLLLVELQSRAAQLARDVAEETHRRHQLEAELVAVRLRGEELQHLAEQARGEADRMHIEAENARGDVKRLQSEVEQARIEVEQARKDITDGFAQILENELQCVICNDLIIKAKSLSCSHTFCSYCIDTWMKKNKECPCCRRPVTSVTLCYVIDNCIEKAVEQMSEERQNARREQLEQRKAELGTATSSCDRTDDHRLPNSASMPGFTTAARFAASRAELAARLGAVNPTASVEPSRLRGVRVVGNPSSSSTVTRNRSAVDGSSDRRNPVASSSSITVVDDDTDSPMQPRRSSRLQARSLQPTESRNVYVVTIESSDEGEEEVSIARPSSQRSRPMGRALSDAHSGDRTEEEGSSSHRGRADRPDDDSGAEHIMEDVDQIMSGANLIFGSVQLDDDFDRDSDEGSSDDEFDQYDSYIAASLSSAGGRSELGSSYVRGLPGSFYGGYGSCHNCGCRGHWANGCPYR